MCLFYTHYIVAKQLLKSPNFLLLKPVVQTCFRSLTSLKKNYVSVIFHCRITVTYGCSRFERKAQKSHLIHTEILLIDAVTPLI